MAKDRNCLHVHVCGEYVQFLCRLDYEARNSKKEKKEMKYMEDHNIHY